VGDLFPVRYVIPVLLGLALALSYPVASHLRAPERRRYYLLQAITLVGALLGAKLVVLMGDRFWPLVPVQGLWDFLTAGRSVVGALLFGFLTAEVAKPILGYTLPPNDRFAALLPFSLAIGRFGCFLQGCCRGIPHAGWLSVTYADGIPRHPAQLFEAAFQIAIGAVFIQLVRRGRWRGQLFAVYLVAYGTYRFLSEFIRETPRVAGEFSVYQAFCVLMIAVGLLTLGLRGGRFDDHPATTATA
jgi:phosphatidylglycerol---prolipoprotein diacylglyceryl transferase